MKWFPHNGYWWPLYVPEWYHPRVSQHFFDPYSFTHILHGFIFYAIFGWWLPVAAAIDNNHWIWYEGSLLALLLEFLIEVAENSEYVIELYRQNSGTSELYDGDSWQNIVGDLISSTFGYYVAALSVHYQVPYFVGLWTLVSEIGLLLYMRDCLLLCTLSLLWPSQTVKDWQAEIIPPEGKIYKPRS